MQTRRRPTVRRGKRVQTISSNFDAVCAVCDLCDVSLSFCINILLESFKCDQMSMSVRFVGTICLNFFSPELSFTVYRLTISMNTILSHCSKTYSMESSESSKNQRKVGRTKKASANLKFTRTTRRSSSHQCAILFSIIQIYPRIILNTVKTRKHQTSLSNAINT